ncbi:tripartite tricarboxylate transporter TctB family protein [Blastococcus colisei]|uniref:Tripartite tricarboxylate transporter TctB family protein n=1 Tax=Blastococcus colisei TaxID=1564162 RepID=A0A543P9X3_9ACTN|nr:tripartite tricarboxylate transporter TctB family protein [Blastococcus colisei]TQN40879.1 tripartite tricarboxylate transporter TctB family protein [Blastococcus colisei]
MTRPDGPIRAAGVATPSAADQPRARRRLPVVDLVVSLGLGALFANAFLISTDWSVRAGLFPRMVTGLGMALALLHVIMLVLRARTAAPAVEQRVDADDEAEEDVEYVFAHAGGRAWAGSLAWVAAFFVGLYVLGLFVTAPLFAFGYLRFSVRRSWVFSLVYAVAVFAVLYLAFELALQLQVPPGLFF